MYWPGVSFFISLCHKKQCQVVFNNTPVFLYFYLIPVAAFGVLGADSVCLATDANSSPEKVVSVI